MIEYKNLSRKSGVLRYEIGSDFIIVEFKDYSKYKYTYQSAGAENIEQMKLLAEQGFGLNSFIMIKVRERYEK